MLYNFYMSFLNYNSMRYFYNNFLGTSPNYYKLLIILFLIINPIIFHYYDPFVAGWFLLVEFIFTLAMSLTVYPLQSGGLLAIEAVFIGMTTTDHVFTEIENNLPVLLLLVFMVSGIFFIKDLLLYIFSHVLVKIRSKVYVSLLFFFLSCFLSAFLDALTVIAVIITVMITFISSMKENSENYSFSDQDVSQFYAFLRSLCMHAAVGTAVGGLCTKVGEPQNLIIAKEAGWDFLEFFLRVSPLAVPIFSICVLICLCLEFFGFLDFGAKMPESIRSFFNDYVSNINTNRTPEEYAKLCSQGLVALWLVIALSFHLAAVGIIGLSIIVLATSFCGVITEHEVGKSFEESLPFTCLLVVFFVIICVVVDQSLFKPVFKKAMSYDGNNMYSMFYLFNGLLSVVSDNVFVGAVYVNEAKRALDANLITVGEFNNIAVMINVGTNIPSIATPNGQAGFLFLLTSSLSSIINLNYLRMVLLALPYSVLMSSLVFILIDSGYFAYASSLVFG